MDAKQQQAQFDAVQKQYLAALYAKPIDHALCLDLATQLRDLARGTRLEARQQQVVERHQRKLA